MSADQLAQLLDELGRRLGPTGEHVVQLAVRQQYINGVLDLIFGAFFVGASVAAVAAFRAYRRRGWARWDALPGHERAYPSLNGRPDGLELILAVGGVGVLVGLAVVSVGAAVTSLLNPEYAAIRDILSAIGGAK